MSKYTVTLHQLIISGYDLGLTQYPIFDEQFRIPLNNKILDHYRFREIGFETPEMFKFFLNRTMNEIMPYYNELWKTLLLEFDPLTNYHMVEHILFTGSEDTDGTETGTGNNTTTTESEQTDTGESTGTTTDTLNTTTTANVTNTKSNTGSVEHEFNETTTDVDDGSNVRTSNIDKKHSDTPQTEISFPEQGNMFVTDISNELSTVTDDINTTKTIHRTGANTDNTDMTETENNTATTRNTGSNTQEVSVNNVNNSVNNATNTNEYVNNLVNKILKAIENETNSEKNGYMNITPMELIKQMRDLIINIEMMIIEELALLFMQIY